jgi:hypothetical protein
MDVGLQMEYRRLWIMAEKEYNDVGISAVRPDCPRETVKNITYR